MWVGQWLINVVCGEFIDRCSADEPVQRGDHRGALASGMVGRAVHCVGEEVLRRLRMCDHLVQLDDVRIETLNRGRRGVQVVKAVRR